MLMRRKLPALLVLLILIISFCSSALAVTPADYDAANPAVLEAGHLASEATILIDASSGDVLFGKNEQTRMYPASTTKIMTLLLALESGIGLDEVIAIPQAAADIAKDSSLIPVYPGDTMTFGDLLYGFMINSGNDGANAIAVLVSGSVNAFVERMNARATEIGCTGTHFANAHGYHTENHYTTAYDLALITREAMKSDAFCTIVSTVKKTIQIGGRGELALASKNQLMVENSGFYYDECIGVKTGFHSAAGYCFVGAAERDGATLISVTLKGAADNDKWTDTTRLFNYGWTRYDTYTIEQMFELAKPQIASVVIANAAKDDPYEGVLDFNLAQISDSSYLRMVEKDNRAALDEAIADFVYNKATVSISREMVAPISMGEIIGSFSYQDAVAGKTITAVLVAGRDVQERVASTTITDIFPFLRIFKNRIFLILLLVLALLIALIIALAVSRRAAKARRRRKIYEQRRREYMRRQQLEAQRRGTPGGNAPSRPRPDGRRPR